MHVVVPASTIALLERIRESLEQKAAGMGEPRKVLPRWLPNGEEIRTLSELAAVLSTDKKTAAYVTLLSIDPSPGLVKEAQTVIHSE
jgi:hypothetical protein